MLGSSNTKALAPTLLPDVWKSRHVDNVTSYQCYCTGTMGPKAIQLLSVRQFVQSMNRRSDFFRKDWTHWSCFTLWVLIHFCQYYNSSPYTW